MEYGPLYLYMSWITITANGCGQSCEQLATIKCQNSTSMWNE